MSVFRRDNKWCIGYSLNGRWVRKTIGTSKKLAVLAEKKINLDIAKGEYLGIIEAKKLLFEELCEEYLQFSKANKTTQSHRRDQTSIKNMLSAFKGKLITRISAHALEQYMNKRREKVTPATVNRELSCIKHMFNKAVQWGYLANSPLRTVKKYKEPPGRVRYLSENESVKLLRQCADHLKPIVMMALNTGMRKGEILNLEWADIDMHNRTITLRKTKNNELRILPVNNILYRTLRLMGQQFGNQYVFSNGDCKPYRDIKVGFMAALRRAGIRDFRFHDLRHTFASRLVMAGVDIRTVQVLLGHKDIKVTMRYSHLSDQNLRKAVDKLSSSEYSSSADRTNTAQSGYAKSAGSAKR
ncbi:MAG: tyrosine-type recombinase/integrase [bacterium]